MTRYRMLLACLAAIPGLAALPAAASSPDAWDALARDVETKCVALTREVIKDPIVTVDAVGSEAFAFAIVRSKATPSAAILCVVDKASGEAQAGMEIDLGG